MEKISTETQVTDRQLSLIGVVLALGALVTLLDTTIVNVALHRLQTEFGSSVPDTQWVALPAALGPILGSVLGGAIVESWNWHWVFLINVPVCALALVLGHLILPQGRAQGTSHFDARGFVLLTPAVIAIAYGVSKTADGSGFGSARAWAPVVAGIVLLALFALHSLRMGGAALIDLLAPGRPVRPGDGLRGGHLPGSLLGPGRPHPR
jgi:MFS family permease